MVRGAAARPGAGHDLRPSLAVPTTRPGVADALPRNTPGAADTVRRVRPPDSPREPQADPEPATAPPSFGATLVRVLAVQVVALALLALVQRAFTP